MKKIQFILLKLPNHGSLIHNKKKKKKDNFITILILKHHKKQIQTYLTQVT